MGTQGKGPAGGSPALWTAVVLSACSGGHAPLELDPTPPPALRDGGLTADGGEPIDVDYRPSRPAPPDPQVDLPAPPEPPRFESWPPGGLGVGRGELAWCEPWAEGVADEPCPSGSMRRPSDADCVRVGTECPADGWPAGVEADYYVRAGAPAGGTGLTEDDPFATIQAALALATTGATIVIAVAPGTYDGPFVLPEGVTIHGACASDVTLTTPNEPGARVVESASPDTGLVNVGITGAARGAVVTGAGASLVVRDVWMRSVKGSGIGAETGAQVSVEASLVDTVGGDVEGIGMGMVATDGASLLADGVVVARGTAVGVTANHGSTVELNDTLVEETRSRTTDGSVGMGVQCAEGSHLEVRRSVLLRNRAAGLYVVEEGSTATVTDVVVRETRLRGDNTFGRGVMVQFVDAFTAERLLVDDQNEAGLHVAEAPVEVRDTIIRNTQSNPVSGVGGRGVSLQNQSTFTFERVWVEDNDEFGIRIADQSQGTLRDVTILRTSVAPRSQGFGRGIEASDSNPLELERIRIEGAQNVGLFLADISPELRDITIRDVTDAPVSNGTNGILFQNTDGARVDRILLEETPLASFGVVGPLSDVTASHVTVRDVRQSFLKPGGRALEASIEGRLTAQHVLIERALDVALSTDGAGAELNVSDAVIRDLVGDPRNTAGRAFDARAGARAVLERVVLEGPHDIGFLAAGAGTDVVLRDIVARDAIGVIGSGLHGRGVGVQHGARMVLERVLIERVREVGVLAYHEGTELIASDVLVQATDSQICTEEECEAFGAGVGVGAYESASIDLERFRVGESALAGIQLSRHGQASLRIGVVADNPVGLHLNSQIEDVGNLAHNVLFVDNVRNLDASEIPVPPPSL